MDTGAYLSMFLAECREHLQELNLAIVRVEREPDDRETVDAIFRIAHSLKGMSATMGFERMAALTHQMEDVLELLRQRSGGLEREAVDVLLACLDALEAAIDSIESDGTDSLDPASLIERLQELVRGRSQEQEAARTGTWEGEPPAVVADAIAAGRTVHHAEIAIDEEALMPSVRALMALTTLRERGEVLYSVPADDELDAYVGRDVEAWIAGEIDVKALEAEIAELAEIASAQIRVPGRPALAAVVELTPAQPQERPEGGSQQPRGGGGATVRVDAERLDALMHHMSELVVVRTRVEMLAAQAAVPGLLQATQQLTRVSHALQSMVMQVRMIPVDIVLQRFPRLVRDLSQRLEKKVELVLEGEDTELDRTVVDMLADPLAHLVRNSLDHGLETPADRVAAGKPETGRLEIKARHAGGNVVITVTDDGRGIDTARVAAIAAKRGLIDASAVDGIDPQQAIELLFTAGFSTAETTTDVSGRGVGMDAVRTAIRELGGDVLLTAEPGQGTTATIRLPLTLAIVSALLVEVGDGVYAVPIDRVERIVGLDGAELREAAGQTMLVLREDVLPLHDAADLLSAEGAEKPRHALLISGRGGRMALGVGELLGQSELVTRPMPSSASDLAAVSAAAVLSDGRIALILDCDALNAVPSYAAPALKEAC